ATRVDHAHGRSPTVNPEGSHLVRCRIVGAGRAVRWAAVGLMVAVALVPAGSISVSASPPGAVAGVGSTTLGAAPPAALGPGAAGTILRPAGGASDTLRLHRRKVISGGLSPKSVVATQT